VSDREQGEEMRDAVIHALSEVAGRHGGMVTKWLACAEVIGEDGERALWLTTNEDAKAWDNLGMLSFMLQREQARLVESREQP
jgi:hypothetical protein